MRITFTIGRTKQDETFTYLTFVIDKTKNNKSDDQSSESNKIGRFLLESANETRQKDNRLFYLYNTLVPSTIIAMLGLIMYAILTKQVEILTIPASLCLPIKYYFNRINTEKQKIDLRMKETQEKSYQLYLIVSQRENIENYSESERLEARRKHDDTINNIIKNYWLNNHPSSS